MKLPSYVRRILGPVDPALGSGWVICYSSVSVTAKRLQDDGWSVCPSGPDHSIVTRKNDAA